MLYFSLQSSEDSAAERPQDIAKVSVGPNFQDSVKIVVSDSTINDSYVQNNASYDLFQSHELKVKSQVSPGRPVENQDGIFILILIVFSLITWALYTQRKRFNMILSALVMPRVILQLIREENSILQRLFVVLSIVFILVFSTFFYQTCLFYGWTIFNAEGIILFVICTLMVGLVYFIKLMVIAFVGNVLEADELVREYLYNIFLINLLLAILLIPIILAEAYMPYIPKDLLIKGGVTLFFITLLYRSLRGIYMGSGRTKFSLYHLFLYFCTLEILPLVVLIKLFGRF